MASIYEQNLEALKKISANFPQKKDCLDGVLLDGIKVRENASRKEFMFEGNYYSLHSKEEKEEVKLLTNNINFYKDNLIILFGIGNTALLQYLFENITASTKVAIFEPNIYVLKYILETYELHKFFATGQFVLFMGEKLNLELEQEIFFYCGLGWENLSQNIQVISLPNYYLYGQFRIDVVKQITAKLNMSIALLGNSLEDMFNGFSNNYMNVDATLSMNSADEIKDKFKGYPAIVVASGPSLDKNIEYLKEAQDKALIITCDASLEACKKHGIKPDAIASIERDKPTYDFYYKGKSFDEDLVLVGPSLLWPEIYENYHGKKIIMNKVDSGADGWWASHFDKLKHINQGLSSAHVAFSVAAYAGCNPIILIGQDLAYTDEKKHSDLTHTEFEGDNDSSESDGTMVEDIYGNLVRTDTIYNLFRNWFEIQIRFLTDVEVIDATEGGAKIHGSTIKGLKETIDQYCKKPLPKHMHEYLEDVGFEQEYAHKKYQEIIEDGNLQILKLKKIQKKAADHQKVLVGLQKKKLAGMTKEELVNVILKMQKGDKIIHYINKEEDVYSFYQQIIKQTIIYVKKIGNEITPTNVAKNIHLQILLMTLIRDSTYLVIEEYNKMITFVSEKFKENGGCVENE